MLLRRPLPLRQLLNERIRTPIVTATRHVSFHGERLRLDSPTAHSRRPSSTSVLTKMDPKQNATAWHDQQRERATTHQPKKFEIPQDHRCPGGTCSQDPPPPPPGTEAFAAIQPSPLPFAWYATVAAAALVFVFMTRRNRG